MPSLFRKLLTPKQSSVNLKTDRRQLKSASGAPTHIKRWTSRNKKDGTSCSLPPELVLKILELAWTDDLSTAATSSLLCKSVLERTRRFLYTCPTLVSASQINLFLRAIKKNPSLANRVVGATLNGQNAGAGKMGNGERIRGAVTTRLPQLLELCTNLQELTLKKAVVFSLTDFSNANSLLHLTLDGCLLSDRTTTQRYQKFYTPLPNVTTLTLRSAEFDLSTADHFLCPRTLPALIALELEGCKLVDNPTSLNDLGIYEPRRLASSLELLVLKVAKNTFPTAEDLATIGELLESCSNLRALQIEAAYLSARLLEHLPLTLTHMALLVAPSPFPDLYQNNLEAAQALSTSFISLAALSTSSSSHPTPFGTASPSGRSPFSTPLLLSPFGSPAPSPPSQQYPLSELIHLRLPRCWEPDVAYGWNEPEFDWAVKRINKVCKERLIRVEYAKREERKKGRVVRGKELREELMKIRKEVPLSERDIPHLWR